MKTLYYYEIKNTRTQETAEVYGHSYQEACISKGWQPKNCRCIYRTEVIE